MSRLISLGFFLVLTLALFWGAHLAFVRFLPAR